MDVHSVRLDPVIRSHKFRSRRLAALKHVWVRIYLYAQQIQTLLDKVPLNS